MENLALTPPVVFLEVLIAMTLFTKALSRLAYKVKDMPSGTCKSYACGENVPTHLMQPDYSQFFPFAFFFTVLHVVTLMIATVPVDDLRSFAMAVIYIAGAVCGLVILFRR
jgi:NADH-quinone oxidoreductase subunit A